DISDAPPVDPRDPSERKRARIEEQTQPVEAAESAPVETEGPGDDDGSLSGGEAKADPYLAFEDEPLMPEVVASES
ncbi:unnamed protein product, partial [Symbiodinium pilosum]